MTPQSNTPEIHPVLKRSRFSARRIVLLGTTVLALGAAAVVMTPALSPYGAPALAQNLSAQAQKVQAPVGFADIVEKVKPAVMSVRVKLDEGTQNSSLDEQQIPPGLREFFRRFGEGEGQRGNGPGAGPNRGGPGGRHFAMGQGSGFFISADGYAVTNNHVVEKAESVQVTTDDGTIHNAKVIGTDPRTDLALIKVEGGNFPYVKLGDAPPRIGDWVIAVGNPFGLGGTVTAGIVSARGRDIGAGAYDDFIQIDAPVNKGNSGGPTFDTEGNVIGVNTAIFSPSGGSVGIAFAIPADTVKTVIAQLKDKGSVTRGWIGVQIQPVTPDIADSLGLKKAEGALVAEPQAGSPAAKAGIKSGDVITSVDGKPVKDARDLAKRIGSMSPNTTVKLGVLSGGSDKTLSLTLGELPNQQEARVNTGTDQGGDNMGKLGLTLAPASRVAGTTGNGEGVVVTGVDPDGVAAEHGFKTGDVIVEVGGQQVSSPADIRKVISTARTDGKRTVLMRVKSGEGTKFVAVPLSRA
jgi:serine protease Do